MINVKIRLMRDYCMPTKATSGSVGFDLYANLDSSVILPSMDRILIPAGFCIELPENYEAQIRPRSGLAYKNGITILNSPGTVDTDYRQEVKVILINLSKDSFEITPKMRIAQMVITKVEGVTLKNEDIHVTSRGGFGSTGLY
ncbi:MAG: dUTP diphosphatase [Alphaproteobacteria bacterium]|nr:MAG: dUTP diphosphatase [Alphaproteobacteria bacterium]